MTQSAPAIPVSTKSSVLREADVTAAIRKGPHARIDVGHSRVATWRFGKGPDVVCIHGWPLHAATFRRIVVPLARDFTVHLLDLPGTGQSECDDLAKIGVAPHIETVRQVVGALGLERYALLAHDSGGAIARLVAEGDPRVSSLVLGNTEIPGHHPWMVTAFVAIARSPGLRRAFLASLGSRRVRQSFMGFGGCFADPSYVEGEFGDLFVRPLATPRTSEGQFAFARALNMSQFDRLRDVHGRIAAPVRLIWGPGDPFFPIAKARAMVPQFRDAHLVEIPGAKLFAHEDFSEDFAALAREHLLATYT